MNKELLRDGRLQRGRELAPIDIDQIEVDQDRLDFSKLWITLKRNIWIFSIIFGGTLLVTGLITANQHRRYAATAQIVISINQASIAPRSGTEDSPAVPSPSDQVDTEVRILTSRDLASNVADVLHLAKNPNFNPQLAPPPSGLLVRLKAALLPRKPVVPISDAAAHRAIVDRLLGGLQVTRSGDSYAVDISATAPTPRDAQRIANTFADQYIRGHINAKFNESQKATTFLSSKLEELQNQAHADTLAVQQYRIANNLLSTSGSSLTEQEISTYNQSVATARAQAAEDSARLNTARNQLRGGSTGDDVGEALGSGVVSQLRGRQAELSGRLASLQSRYNDAHPDVIKAKSELADVDSQIRAEIGRVISNLEAKSRVSRERLGSITGSLSHAQGTLAQNNRAMTNLDDLQRRAAASQGMYESYLARYKQVSTESGIEQANARLISAAELPSRPVSPNIPLNIILGTLLGLGFGITGAFIGEFIFSGLTTGEEVERKLHLSFLASVPIMPATPKERGEGLEALLANPRSMLTEAFRALRASVIHDSGQVARTVMITSALPKEGKSTIAVGLGRVIAHGNNSVVLVDCDHRRARVTRQFVGDRNVGLLELLAGETTLDQVLVKDQLTDLAILPLSTADSAIDDLLAGERMHALIDELRRRFTYVILDTPPLLAIAEARVLATMVDKVLMVVRWRHTADHAVKTALRMLPRNHVHLAGVVLNRVNMKKMGRFGRGDAASYHRQYKSYYS